MFDAPVKTCFNVKFMFLDGNDCVHGGHCTQPFMVFCAICVLLLSAHLLNFNLGDTGTEC